MADVTMRVSDATRDQVMRIAAEDYGGLSADQALRRLLDEHWERRALADMERFRTEDPVGYAEYQAELTGFDAVPGPTMDEWAA